MDTTVLVKKAKKGDKEALITLVMDRKDEYYKLAYVYLGNEHDAMDALQEMILILFNQIKKIKKPESFYSWSKTILVNCCRAELRKKKRTHNIEFQQEELDFRRNPFNNNDGLNHFVYKSDIMTSLQRLNLHQQEAIKLKYFLDLDNATIAKLTGVPEGTVKSRIFNGLKRIREMLGGDYKNGY